MPCILFLIDTSLSMNRRSSSGRTMLDLAKNSITSFIKTRQRDPTSRTDRYMLLTTDAPYNIKIDWRDSSGPMDNFHREVRSLTFCGNTNLDQAITKAFDLLNMHRISSGVDNYGCGRLPWYVEVFSMVVLITDGNLQRSHHDNGSYEEFEKPVFSLAESKLKAWELTPEPFRWDQRLFALVLKIASQPNATRDTTSVRAANEVTKDGSALGKICERTGGRSYAVNSEKVLNQCIESVVQKLQVGMVCNFKVVPPTGGTYFSEPVEKIIKSLPSETRKMLLLKTKVGQNGLTTNTPQMGHWPIPEDFLPDVTNSRQRLPSRTAHPSIIIVPINHKPIILNNFAFDKYELEPSPLTQQIITLYKSHPTEYNTTTTAWYTYVLGSNGVNRNSDIPGYVDHDSLSTYQSSAGGGSSAEILNNLPPPFGYLKPNTNLSAINLYVMPFNFPKLIPLIDELLNFIKQPVPNPHYKWKNDFAEYLMQTPAYYIGHLSKALRAINAPQQVIDTTKQYGKVKISPGAHDQIRDMQVKASRETQNNPDWRRKTVHVSGAGEPCTLRKTIALKSIIPDDDYCLHNFRDFRLETSALKKEVLHPYINPFHIERSDLLTQLSRMRRNLHAIMTQHKLIETAEGADARRSQPIAQMGQFEGRMKSMVQPLRKIELTKTSLLTNRSKGATTSPKSAKKQGTFTADENFDEGIDPDSADGLQTPVRRKRKLPPSFQLWKKKRESGEPVGPTHQPAVPMDSGFDDVIDDYIDDEQEDCSGAAAAPENKMLTNLKATGNRAGSPRPLSRSTPLDIQRALKSVEKIDRLLKSPARPVALKDQIKKILADFDDEIKTKILDKSIALCEKFKRYMLKAYLMNLVRLHKSNKVQKTTSSISSSSHHHHHFIPIKVHGLNSLKRDASKELIHSKPNATILSSAAKHNKHNQAISSTSSIATAGMPQAVNSNNGGNSFYRPTPKRQKIDDGEHEHDHHQHHSTSPDSIKSNNNNNFKHKNNSSFASAALLAGSKSIFQTYINFDFL